nr:MAG TPA: hypothetical protein [Caudoviricetes sp.]
MTFYAICSIIQVTTLINKEHIAFLLSFIQKVLRPHLYYT